MSRFYVGQRVRVRETALAEYRGMECAVVEVIEFEDYLCGPALRLDCNGFADFCGLQDDVEPIVPPGMESLAETLALWQPEGVAA